MLLSLVVLGAAGAGGYFYWFQSRETRVVCHVALEGYEVSDSAYLMNPLIAEIERLYQQYTEQREPLLKDRTVRQDAVAAAEKGAQEVDARLAAAQQNLAAVEARQKQEVSGKNNVAQEEFEARFKALDAELARTREDFHRAIGERAKKIQIQFSEDAADNEPDLVVSRFRTGLYGAGVGVDRKAEQSWAEEQLGHWRKYYEFWQTQRASLQEQFKQTQGQMSGVLERQKAELEQARAAVAEVEKQVMTARAGVEAARKTVDESKHDPKAAETALLAQMDELPEKFKLAAGRRREDGAFVFDHLDTNPNVPQGRYVVFVRARKGEEEYWGFLNTEVLPFEETTVRMFPDHLLNKRRMLVEGKFEND